MRTMRPRGLSISWPSSEYVGHAAEAEAAVNAGLDGVGHRGGERAVFILGDGVEHQAARDGKRFCGSRAVLTAAAMAVGAGVSSQSGPGPRSVSAGRPSEAAGVGRETRAALPPLADVKTAGERMHAGGAGRGVERA